MIHLWLWYYSFHLIFGRFNYVISLVTFQIEIWLDWELRYFTVLKDCVCLISQNGVSCQFLFILVKFLRYLWSFGCEKSLLRCKGCPSPQLVCYGFEPMILQTTFSHWAQVCLPLELPLLVTFLLFDTMRIM